MPPDIPQNGKTQSRQVAASLLSPVAIELAAEFKGWYRARLDEMVAVLVADRAELPKMLIKLALAKPRLLRTA